MNKLDLYEAVFDNTASLFIVLDRHGKIVMFNPACERTSGYRLEEVRGRVLWDFLLTREERDPVRNIFEKLRAGNFPNAYQNHWVTKSGELRFIEWSNSAITDDGGAVTYVISTGIDSTERMDVQARLAEIADTIPIALWVREVPANRVSYVSRGFWNIWGGEESNADSMMSVFSDSIHPEDREILFQRLAADDQDGIASDVEFRIVRGDGMLRWVRSRSFPIHDDRNNVARVIGYAEDITDRKLDQQALENLRGRQSAILNAISDSVFLKDADFRYIEVNRCFLERHEIERDQVIGKTAHDIFPDNEASAIEARDRRVFDSGQPLQSEVLRTVSGRQRSFNVLRYPVIDGTGSIIGIVATSRDISDQKAAEFQRTEREVALRTTLVKEVHHRIKNNLQGAISLLDQAILQYPTLAGPLTSLGTRLNAIALVHGLHSGMLEQEVNFCNITTAVATAARMIHGEDVLNIALEPGFQAVELRSDETVPIALVVNELINNAIKHAAPGAPRPVADVHLQRKPSTVTLRVKNFTGALPGSFDYSGGGGLGTGLRLLRSLVPSVGATLEIENCPEGGVEAVLILMPPVIQERAQDKRNE